MSKTLICIRHGHAKDPIGLKDFDRPLSKRGKMEALNTAENLAKLNIPIDQMIYSSAIRTTESAHIISNHIGYNINDAISSKKLYLCTPNEIEDFVATNAKSTANTLVLIGHNNGLSDWANQLLHLPINHNLSTCELVTMRLEISSWEQIYEGPKAQLICFEKPKNEL